MAEEEKKESRDEQQAQEPQAEEPADRTEQPGAEEAQPEEAPAEEAKPEEAPAEEAKPEPEAEVEAAGEAEVGELAGAPPPKQLRKVARSRFTGEPAPQRSPEQRSAERAAARAKKAEVRRRSRSRARAKAKERQPATPRPPAPVPAERHTGHRKVRQGTVVSSRADKTISVRVMQVRRHPVYKKTMRVTSTLHAHDEKNEAKPGDLVRVTECRPLSRTKRWRLTEILERAR